MTENPESMLPVGRLSRWWIAPALASIYPVLSLYVDSYEEAKLSDALACGIIVAGLAIVAAYLFRLVFDGATRASLASVLLVVWFFTFAAYRKSGKLVIEAFSSSQFNDYILMGIWLLVLPIVLLLLYRLRLSDRRMQQLYQFVELACLFTIGIVAFQGIRGHWSADHIVARAESIWGSDSEALPVEWKPVRSAAAPDIYYLIFDRYGSGDALQKYFGFDNSEFYNELEKRGFVVDRKAVTSYPMTAPAMSSTLNMRYLSSQFGIISDYFLPLEMNEVAKRMIAAGYKYDYFGNQYAPLRKSSLAQWNMKISMLPCEFADSLVWLTPLRPLIGRQHKRQFVLEKFDAIAELAKDPAAIFAYAHFLVPHPPYAFTRDGSALSEFGRATRPEPELYIDQLVATNRLILKMIDEILSSSTTKPIIILQADEGPYLMAGDESLPRDDQIAKRSGILNAILIPDDDIRQRLPKPLLPVNTFRFLFKEYFGAPIALLPDHVFYWETPDTTGVATPGSRIVEVPHK